MEFNSDLWKQVSAYRRSCVGSIIREGLLLGKSKKEIRELLGMEENYTDLNEWAYFINKNVLGIKTYLLLNFKNEYVENVELYRVIELRGNLYFSI